MMLSETFYIYIKDKMLRRVSESISMCVFTKREFRLYD